MAIIIKQDMDTLSSLFVSHDGKVQAEDRLIWPAPYSKRNGLSVKAAYKYL